MTKKRQILFTLVRGFVAILIALLVATLLIFISAKGEGFSAKLAATGKALQQMLIGPLFRTGRSGAAFELKRLTDIFRAKIIDVTDTSYVIELTGASRKLDAFIDALPEGLLIEVVRSGPTGIARGEKGLTL